MPRYVTRLRIKTTKPLTRDQLHLFDQDRHGTKLRGKLDGHDLAVTLTMSSGDPLGALARASNYVLDRIPGDLQRVEAEVSESR